MFDSRFPNIERRDSGPAHRDATADHEVGYEAAYVPAALATAQAEGAAQPFYCCTHCDWIGTLDEAASDGSIANQGDLCPDCFSHIEPNEVTL